MHDHCASLCSSHTSAFTLHLFNGVGSRGAFRGEQSKKMYPKRWRILDAPARAQKGLLPTGQAQGPAPTESCAYDMPRMCGFSSQKRSSPGLGVEDPDLQDDVEPPSPAAQAPPPNVVAARGRHKVLHSARSEPGWG